MLLAIAAPAFSAGKGAGGNSDKQISGQGSTNANTKQEKAEHGKARKHARMNGHNLLGDKHDGKHQFGKLANRNVTADVKRGKVVNMAAGDLPMKRVKTKMKMAETEGGIIPVAWTGAPQLAQYQDYSSGYEVYYYGYCFDDGYEFTCYWYPASDVDYVDYSWDDYDPYY